MVWPHYQGLFIDQQSKLDGGKVGRLGTIKAPWWDGGKVGWWEDWEQHKAHNEHVLFFFLYC